MNAVNQRIKKIEYNPDGSIKAIEYFDNSEPVNLPVPTVPYQPYQPWPKTERPFQQSDMLSRPATDYSMCSPTGSLVANITRPMPVIEGVFTN
jgi:hypothetical protein